MLVKKRLLSIDVSSGSYNEFIGAILKYAIERVSSYVCVANVHMLIEAHNTPKFADVVNQADIVTPDGMPLAQGFKYEYNLKQDRVDGMSLLPALLAECEKSDLSVYFYGGDQKTLNTAETHIREAYPTLRVAGLYSPPFRKLTEAEKLEDEQRIRDSGAHLIFVALGCPKQEMWMAEMKGKVPALMIGIGGALPVFTGSQKRAPKWMQDNSLEWVYRLVQEPKRLFKRYLTTNSKFLYLLAKEKLKTKS
ncbi:WecB/TagA/CpsF family glycosyltransferase [Pedobacter sp. V48]|uniref:WecB/TagA/CpsF family glycosyltransferase n=1 Tax=Pedobacter sp. V48 TaxID=509635 RepID=UPI0003E49D43|nr:WecB/TagA/CpsF family glycosyltransferase [Pedobacter sp. V48]ETZ24572.1 hypothetical protein N824_13725 [Pedobacter sp. V48]